MVIRSFRMGFDGGPWRGTVNMFGPQGTFSAIIVGSVFVPVGN